eukprot:12006-Heterococcus_DN1.PRE.1
MTSTTSAGGYYECCVAGVKLKNRQCGVSESPCTMATSQTSGGDPRCNNGIVHAQGSASYIYCTQKVRVPHQVACGSHINDIQRDVASLFCRALYAACSWYYKQY